MNKLDIYVFLECLNNLSAWRVQIWQYDNFMHQYEIVKYGFLNELELNACL